MNMPFMFATRRPADENNTVDAIVYVVMRSQSWTLRHYNAAWMQDPILSKGPTFVPDVDIVAEDDVFVFDSPDGMQNELDAVAKMKELWSEVQFNGG